MGENLATHPPQAADSVLNWKRRRDSDGDTVGPARSGRVQAQLKFGCGIHKLFRREKRRVLLLGRAHAGRAGPFFAAFHFKLDALTFPQAVKVQLLEAGPMKENLLSVSRPDKAKTAITDNPFDRPFHNHLD